MLLQRKARKSECREKNEPISREEAPWYPQLGQLAPTPEGEFLGCKGRVLE